MDRDNPACDRSAVFVRRVTIALACLLAWGCRNPFTEAAPIEAGGVLSYMVSERAGEDAQSYVLRARLVDVEDGLELQMHTPKKTLSIPVDDRLVPIDEELLPIEYPLVLTSTMARPGLLWLPSDRRTTSEIVLHQRWRAWTLVGEDGMPRYYEVETGLLVDFKLFVGGVRVSGQLVSAQ